MYKEYVETQLENQRKEMLKINGQKVIQRLDLERCPVCTLKVPCNHFSVKELKEYHSERQYKQEHDADRQI
jgi:DNA repair exonuclease SbcCD ATPase subunit